MATKTEVNQYGVSFLSLLALLFIGLKLFGATEVATWSWWWVLAPIWMPAALVLGIFLVIVVFTIVANG